MKLNQSMSLVAKLEKELGEYKRDSVETNDAPMQTLNEEKKVKFDPSVVDNNDKNITDLNIEKQQAKEEAPPLEINKVEKQQVNEEAPPLEIENINEEFSNDKVEEQIVKEEAQSLEIEKTKEDPIVDKVHQHEIQDKHSDIVPEIYNETNQYIPLDPPSNKPTLIVRKRGLVRSSTQNENDPPPNKIESIPISRKKVLIKSSTQQYPMDDKANDNLKIVRKKGLLKSVTQRSEPVPKKFKEPRPSLMNRKTLKTEAKKSLPEVAGNTPIRINLSRSATTNEEQEHKIVNLKSVSSDQDISKKPHTRPRIAKKNSVKTLVSSILEVCSQDNNETNALDRLRKLQEYKESPKPRDSPSRKRYATVVGGSSDSKQITVKALNSLDFKNDNEDKKEITDLSTEYSQAKVEENGVKADKISNQLDHDLQNLKLSLEEEKKINSNLQERLDQAHKELETAKLEMEELKLQKITTPQVTEDRAYIEFKEVQEKYKTEKAQIEEQIKTKEQYKMKLKEEMNDIEIKRREIEDLRFSLEEEKDDLEEQKMELEQEAQVIAEMHIELIQQRKSLEADALGFLAEIQEIELLEEAKNSIEEDDYESFAETLEELDDVNKEFDDPYYPTLLHLAVYYNRPKMAQLLLEKGAALIDNEHEQTPCDIAALEVEEGDTSFQEILELLESVENI